MRVSGDELTNGLIQYHREVQEGEQEHNSGAPDSHAYPEAHYNHFGNRGAVDLYVTAGEMEGHVYEIKSTSAVREATGANEILRQFNKMRKYFFDGSQHDPPTYSITFELCFTPSDTNFRHIAENADMYRSAITEQLYDGPTEHIGSSVTIRPPNPDNITPILMQRPNYDFRDHYPEGSTTFTEYVEYTQPEIFERFEDTIRDISTA